MDKETAIKKIKTNIIIGGALVVIELSIFMGSIYFNNWFLAIVSAICLGVIIITIYYQMQIL